jgi:hypothetical protein
LAILIGHLKISSVREEKLVQLPVLVQVTAVLAALGKQGCTAAHADVALVPEPPHCTEECDSDFAGARSGDFLNIREINRDRDGPFSKLQKIVTHKV